MRIHTKGDGSPENSHKLKDSYLSCCGRIFLRVLKARKIVYCVGMDIVNVLKALLFLLSLLIYFVFLSVVLLFGSISGCELFSQSYKTV